MQFGHLLRYPAALAVVALATGCAGLQQAMDAQKPTVSLESMRVEAIDFDRADVVFELRVDNPNAFDIDLAGFDYAIALEGKDFLSGRRDRKISLPANGSDTLAVPLTIPFARVQEIVGDLRERDEIAYAIEVASDVELGVLGARRVEATERGTLPVPRRPSISLQGVGIDRMSLSGAELVLRLAVDNPNTFGVTLERLDYSFAINGQRWAAGDYAESVRIGAEAQTVLALPVSVRFANMGASAYELLQGNARVDYRFEANLAGKAGLQGFGAFELPLEQSGRVELAP